MNWKTLFILVLTLSIVGTGAFFLLRVDQAPKPGPSKADRGAVTESPATPSAPSSEDALPFSSAEDASTTSRPSEVTTPEVPEVARPEQVQPGRRDESPPPVDIAGQPSLSLPIDCEPGVNCWIANYVDVEPDPEFRDYACGRIGYDGHKGTDFAIRDMAAMRRGVAVVAAAAGKVLGARDTMADINVNQGGAGAVKNVECGNGVQIDIGNGWTTQYCHLRKGSVRVKKGDVVAVGDELGEVGLSGFTEFPHVHLQVVHDGAIVDPFAGLNRTSFCGVGQNPLWRKDLLDDLAYSPVQIYNIGITGRGPRYREVANGEHRPERMAADVPALVLWAEIFGVQSGDRLRMVIEDGAGNVVHDNTIKIDRTQSRRFQFSGKKRPGALWPAGAYHGRVTVTRANDKLGPGTYAAESTVEIR